MAYEQIIYTVADSVATVTLNRPARLNAWTRLMAEEVRSAMLDAADDNEVRVIVLTGAGRGFCAGADMADLENASKEVSSVIDPSKSAEQIVSVMTGTRIEDEREGRSITSARPDFRKRYSYLLGIPKPIIAAVNGAAFGFGMIMSLLCDVRFAAESARFSTAFSKRGLIAEHGIAWLLPRIVGLSNALDLLFSARSVDAEEALRIGLVNRISSDDGLMENVLAYARELATSVSPRSLGVMKNQVYNALFQTLAEASETSDEELIASFQSEDAKEGIAHFLEKRTPRFTGK